MALSRNPINAQRFGTADEVYAIGAVIVAWNLCEGVLFQLLMRAAKLQPKTATRVFNLLGNQSRLDLLRLESSSRLDPEDNERVLNFITAYGICLENRNLIAHSQIYMNAADDGLSLLKISSKDRITYNQYTVPTAEMMDVAVTTYDLAQWGMAVSLAIWAGPTRTLQAGGKPFAAPLPGKFPLPRKLSPLPPEDRRSAPPQPQS